MKAGTSSSASAARPQVPDSKDSDANTSWTFDGRSNLKVHPYPPIVGRTDCFNGDARETSGECEDSAIRYVWQSWTALPVMNELAKKKISDYVKSRWDAIVGQCEKDCWREKSMMSVIPVLEEGARNERGGFNIHASLRVQSASATSNFARDIPMASMPMRRTESQ